MISPLLGQEFSQKIPLHEWVIQQQRTEPNKAMLAVYNLLNKHGRYFPNKVADPITLELLPSPIRIENRKCHSNSVLYACTLNEDYPKFSSDFKFVSGIYGLKAIVNEVPKDKRYNICHHSFLIYKDLIVDWTKIYYPPIGYKVDQYFGIAYSIPVVTETMEVVIDANADMLIPLIPLLKKPFIIS